MALRPDAFPTTVVEAWAPPTGTALTRVRARLTARPSESTALFVASFLLFTLLGAALVTVGQVVVGDAWSRVGNGYYVLFSRDPHLAAIGFVWNPLPSIAVMPLLLLSPLWHDLASAGFAGNLVSAIFMAAAVVELAGLLRDLGVGRVVRLVLVACFVLHPMTLYYGSNGMSEAMFLFFLIVTIRYLSRWLGNPTTNSLVVAGLGLAGAYLTRYEAAAAAIAAIGLVAIVSAHRAPSGIRRMTGLADAATFALPFGAAFALWSLASWIIVGSPFETFTSVYGNSSQVALSAEAIQSSTGRGFVDATVYAITQIQGLEPLLVVALVLAGIAFLVRRDPRVLAAIAIFGAVLAFSLVAFATGKSFGWLRFYIAVVPLTVITIGWLVATWGRDPRRSRLRNVTFGVLTAAALVVPILGIPEAVGTIRDDRLAREEAHQIRGLIPDAAHVGSVPPERAQYQLGGEVARYLDALDIPDGKVVVDVALGFPIVLQSHDPRQFVITTDRDFKAVVQDPVVFHAGYLLVGPPNGLGYLDALTRQYPTLYHDGGGLPVSLVREFDTPGFPGMAWRLFRVNDGS